MFSWPLRTVTVEAVQQFLFLVCLVSFVEEDFFPHKPFFFKFQLNGVATTMTTTTMTMASLCDDFWSSARLLFSQVLIRIKNGDEKNIGHLISIGVTTSSRWEATCSTFSTCGVFSVRGGCDVVVVVVVVVVDTRTHASLTSWGRERHISIIVDSWDPWPQPISVHLTVST